MKQHETAAAHVVASALLARHGRDPALGSGPIATVSQDIRSLPVYFAVVRAFGV